MTNISYSNAPPLNYSFANEKNKLMPWLLIFLY